MAWVAPVAAAAGGVLSGLIGKSGQDNANEMNYRIFRENRDWETMMANTQVQRRVKDLREAGLNPMLGYAGEAAVPSNATPRMENSGESLAQGIQSGISSALQAKMISQQKEMNAAQIEAQEALAKKTNAEAGLITATTPANAQKAEWDAANARQMYDKFAEEIESLKQDILTKQLTRDEVISLQVEYQRILNRAATAGLSEKEADSQFWKNLEDKGWAAKAVMYLKQLLK